MRIFFWNTHRSHLLIDRRVMNAEQERFDTYIMIDVNYLKQLLYYKREIQRQRATHNNVQHPVTMNDVMTRRANTKKYMKLRVEVKERDYQNKCLFCRRKFLTLTGLRMHLTKMHGDMKWVELKNNNSNRDTPVEIID